MHATPGCGRDGGPGRTHVRRVAGHARGARACDHATTHERRRASACASPGPAPASSAPALDAERAFAELVGDHIPGMVRRARRLLGSDDLAWDAVQESLLSLWQAPARPAETRPWLMRTVTHRCLHIRRTLHRRWRHEERAGRAAAEAEVVHGPVHELERDTIRLALRRAVSDLPRGQRRAFVLRELEGLDYRTIASRLSISIGTVRSRLARARDALRHALHGVGPVG